MHRGIEDDDLNQELAFTDLSSKREIKRLEQEIPQWEIMLEKSGMVEGTFFDNLKTNDVICLTATLKDKNWREIK